MEQGQTPVPGQGAVTPDAVPELAHDAAIQIDGQNVPISELVAAREQLSQVKSELDVVKENSVSPERLAEMELIDKALKGDPAAGQQVWNKYAPQEEAPAEPLTVEGQQLAAMQQELEALRGQVSRATGVTDTITQQQSLQQLGQAILGNAETFPNLAEHPQSVALVNDKLERYETLANQTGKTMREFTDDQKQQIINLAFQEVEKGIIQTITHYGGTPRTAPAKGTPITAIDDQAGEKEPGVHRAYMGTDSEGNLIDRRTGKVILNAQGDRRIPDATVAAVPSGTPLGFGQTNEFSKDQVFTMKSLKGAMKDTQSTL